MSDHKWRCALCDTRLNIAPHTQSRKRLTDPWKRKACLILNEKPSNKNDFVCKSCYGELRDYLVGNQDLLPFTEAIDQADAEPLDDVTLDDPKVYTELEFNDMTENRCAVLTGINLSQLRELERALNVYPPKPISISMLNCLGIYLMKLKLGISSNQLGNLYNRPGVHLVKDAIKFVRDVLFDNLTPLHIGVNPGHIRREDIIRDHTTTMSRTLLAAKEDAVITIWDATYVYIEKSSSYAFQRSTFSGHKHRPLVKFMIIAAADGYMVDVIGPYVCNGSNNDASITQSILETNINSLADWFERDDIFVVDRGFRDACKYLEGRRFQVKMPSFLKGSLHSIRSSFVNFLLKTCLSWFKGDQHSTSEANSSRIVTKIRWVIESVNSRIKKWKYFANVIQNNDISTIGKDFTNICALINMFRPQIANTDDSMNLQAYQKMLIVSARENLFAEECQDYSKRILERNRQVDPSLIRFPELSEEYIQTLTFGVYQLKQARSYTAEHLDAAGNYVFELYQLEETVIHVKLRSRHSGSTVHDCWIKYDDKLKLTEGQTPILSWYCKCKAGARVFGMCAHITSVLWYLGVARSNKNLSKKRKADLYASVCLDTRESNAGK